MYFLNPHSFACATRHHWIVLDAAADRYLCIDKRTFEQLSPWISGWHHERTSEPREGSDLTKEAAALASDLIEMDILTETVHDATRQWPIAIPRPVIELPKPKRLGFGGFSLPHALSFFTSCAKASRALSRDPLMTTLLTVAERNNRAKCLPGTFDHEKAIRLSTIFHGMRLFYSRDCVCMFDSLSLLNFLARHDVFPDWVFGVATDPFIAHCWLQKDELVLNDTVDRVSQFSPIMRV